MQRQRHDDTIFALATPSGVGAIAVVRCSGPAARAAAETMLRRGDGRPVSLISHRVHVAQLHDPATGRLVDEVVALLMAAPRSFTREDVVELHCHGGPVTVRRVLALLAAAGLRPAEPGEFTRRAFLNGRVGLIEAEAIGDLITAPSDTMADLALDQLHGSLRARIGGLRAALIDLGALIEANMDFPEEDIEILDRGEVAAQARSIRGQIEELAQSYERGRLLRGGIRTMLAGRPNAGKSSFLNLLLKSERAIVSDVPGTTRDTIEEGFSFRGVLFSLVDSAGLRSTVEPVEAIGVQRSRELLAKADLVLYLVDLSQGPDVEEGALLDAADPARFQLVLNKADLPRALPAGFEERYQRLRPRTLCAITGAGLTELLAELERRGRDEILTQAPGGLITSERHRVCLEQSATALGHFLEAVDRGIPMDVAVVDLYEATTALGHIIGEVVTEDILDRVFERFCIGK